MRKQGFWSTLGEIVAELCVKEAEKQQEIRTLTARLSELTGSTYTPTVRVVAPSPIRFWSSFTVGDVVTLKSGGMPMMTVINKNDSEDTTIVQWYDGVLHTATFPTNSLGQPMR